MDKEKLFAQIKVCLLYTSVGVQLHKPTAYHLGWLIVPSNVQQLTVGSAGIHQQVYDLVDNVLAIRAEPEQKVYLQRLRKIFFQLGAFAHPIRFVIIESVSYTHLWVSAGPFTLGVGHQRCHQLQNVFFAVDTVSYTHLRAKWWMRKASPSSVPMSLWKVRQTV